MTHAEKFIAEAERVLRRELLVAQEKEEPLTPVELNKLQYTVQFLKQGAIVLTGPDTVDEWVERLRNHFP